METTFNNLADFKSKLASDTDLQDAFKADPVEAGKIIAQNPIDNDPVIYRIVVGALAATILSIIVGVLILMGTQRIVDDKSVPTLLTAVGSAAIGALSGLLAPSPGSRKG